MDLSQYQAEGPEIFFGKLNEDFFDRRITEANFTISIAGSTHRAFSMKPPKKKGAVSKALSDGANELKLYLDTNGTSIKTKSDFLIHHKKMFDIFKRKLLAANVFAMSDGTYLKAINIIVWHYALGSKSTTPPLHLTHLREFLHPSFDGDVLRGLLATLRKTYPCTSPKINGWSKSGSRSGIIQSYPQYLSLVEWLENYLPDGCSLVAVDNFWRMDGCR